MSGITSVGENTGRRRREVLRLLRSSPVPLSIVAIAEQLGVHPNTVRFHLDSLLASRQVEQVEHDRKGPGRPPLMFQAVRQMDRGGTRHYRMLAEVLTEALAADRNPRAKAVAAGKAWGRSLESRAKAPKARNAEEAVNRLVGVLDDLGFAPERRTSDGQQVVGLRHCPFLELAESRGAVVCPIHLGLMQGALETWGAPVSVDRLDAFVEPDLCLAHISPARSAR
ncbi:metalloregulator ArsR/SmtB family transcription factor [Mycobacterium sp. 1081908.1]|uniref:helix-turn-helix transcriptional regulator n=1 Tax=Mycobacterium sp. 1081908.1 TaxID=1834066 RepID=UPI0008014823|nr:helix-turn-helix domain-containing protein [Mycobacterium sp. 1081908.1]OBK51617.1 transcriptional regulator [Mycobacterium sp. 1081908.1]